MILTKHMMSTLQLNKNFNIDKKEKLFYKWKNLGMPNNVGIIKYFDKLLTDMLILLKYAIDKYHYLVCYKFR